MGMYKRPHGRKRRLTNEYTFYLPTRHRLWVLVLTLTLTRSVRLHWNETTLREWVRTRYAALRATRVIWRIRLTSTPLLATVKGVSCRRQLLIATCPCRARVIALPLARTRSTSQPSRLTRIVTLLWMWLRERLFSGLPPLDLTKLPE